MKKLIYFILISTACISCNKIIEVDPPKAEIPYDNVFANDANALAAISGLYQQMGESSNFASGGTSSITMLGGLSSDELRAYYSFYLDYIQFQDNILSSVNPYILPLWNTAYETIYRANDILAGLETSTGVTEAQKTQMKGEAFFIRAFTHFYLTNLFGDVPIVLTTNYQTNSTITRQSQDDVYDQIIKDLIIAKEGLSETYLSTERVRPNKSTARAMLSRVYLYRKQWQLAEQEAGEIIQINELYSLADLNEVFLANSRETIWQLMPSSGVYNTLEGNIFVMTNGPQLFVLRDEIVNAFEPEDKRKDKWIDSIAYPDATTILYYPSKYKIKSGSVLSEYSMVFRLAEQYLIRAEARAQQDNLESAIADVDVLRDRAGLPLIALNNPGISKADLLTAILQERRVELFTEWGHRWMDIKRTNTADQIIGNLKPDWNNNKLLYPIPQQELNNNPFLGDQNEGY